MIISRKLISSSRLGLMLILLLIVSATTGLLFVGVGSEESLQFSAGASQAWSTLSEGLHIARESGSVEGIDFLRSSFSLGIDSKLVSLFSQAAIYKLFGVSELSTSVPPILLHGLACLLIFLIVDEHINRRAATFAAMVWALMPAAIFSTSQFLATETGIAIFIAIIFLEGQIIHENQGIKNALTIFLLILLFLEVVFMGLAALFFILFARQEKKIREAKLLFFWPILLLFMDGATIQNSLSQFQQLMAFPGFSLLMLSAIIALALLTWHKIESPSVLGIAGAVIFPFAVFPSLLLESTIGAVANIYLLIGLVISFVVGQWLGQFFQDKYFSRVAFALAILLINISYLLNVGIARGIPYPGSSSHLVFYLLNIFDGLAIIVFIFSAVIEQSSGRTSHSRISFLGIFLFFGALLGAASSIAKEQIRENAALRATFQNSGQDLELSTLAVIQNRNLAAQLAFHARSKNINIGQIPVVNYEEHLVLSEEFLVSWNHQGAIDLDVWRLDKSFGIPGEAQLNLFQKRSSQNELLQAKDCLSLISEQVQEYGTAGAVVVVPLRSRDLELCQRDFELEDLVGELQDSLGARYLQPQLNEADHQGDAELKISRKYTFFLDPRIFDYQVSLEPKAAYIYSISVHSKEAITLLYLGTENQEGAFGGGEFEDWHTQSVLILTPNWAQSQKAVLSPAIFWHYGDVHFKDFFFQRIDLQP